jgi:adenylate cyclase
MSEFVELEKTYLLKYMPKGLEKSGSKEVADIYLPKSARHPVLRIRKYGDKFEITKKEPHVEGDASQQLEQTIPLSDGEFREMSKLEGKRVRKIRYAYDYKGRTADIAIFQDELEGLVLVDFEFTSVEEMKAFEMPDFCLADVTHDESFAGGMLCGKKYADIETQLAQYGYSKLHLD